MVKVFGDSEANEKGVLASLSSFSLMLVCGIFLYSSSRIIG